MMMFFLFKFNLFNLFHMNWLYLNTCVPDRPWRVPQSIIKLIKCDVGILHILKEQLTQKLMKKKKAPEGTRSQIEKMLFTPH